LWNVTPNGASGSIPGHVLICSKKFSLVIGDSNCLHFLHKNDSI
jgi:hypothetical protein